MNIGAILIGIAGLVIAVPFVINPIVNQRKKLAVESGSPKKHGDDQQKNTLAAIRDLDFDFHTGKITPGDYETLRPQLIAEAAEYMQTKQQDDEKIEAMIRLRSEEVRAQAVKPTLQCDQCDGEIGAQDPFCPKCGSPVKKPTGVEEPAEHAFCPNCGKRVKAYDRYCIRCGRQLLGQSTVAANIPANN